MSIVLLLISSAWVGAGGNTLHSFDRVEINHKLDCDGKESFTQVIAWNWDYEYCRFNCEGWRLATAWQKVNGGVRFQGSKGEWDVVRTRVVMETWTEHDPEVMNQRVFPLGVRSWQK